MPEEKGQNSSNDISRILSLFEKERERERELESWMSEIFAEYMKIVGRGLNFL